jgi:hypothetical protein
MSFMPFVTVEVCEKSPFGNECWSFFGTPTKLVSLSLSSFTPLKSIFCCTTCTGEKISYYGLLPAWIAVIGTIILLAIFVVAMIWQRGRIPKAVICMMVGVSALIAALVVHEDPIPFASPFMPYRNFIVLSVNFNIAFEILLAVAVGIILVGVLEMAQRPRRLFGVEALIPYVPEEREREELTRRLLGGITWPKLRLPRLSLKLPKSPRRGSEPERPDLTPSVETESPQPQQYESETETETEAAGNEREDAETTQEASAPTRPMVCRKCGRQLRQGARFCPVCRTRVEVPQSKVQPREETPAGDSDEQADRDTLTDRFMGKMSRLVQGPLDEEEERAVAEKGGREGAELVSAHGFKRWRIAGFRYDNPFLNWGLLIAGALMFLVGITQGLLGG